MLIPAISQRTGLVLVAAASFGLVAAGYGLGVARNLHPCPLCIFQRLLYIVVGCLALLAAAAPKPAWRWPPAGLAVVAALGGLATAAYQSWMQAFPGSIMECGYAEPNLIERLVDWLGERWETMFLATGLCSSKEWMFLGLSMANWSNLCFAALAAAILWSMRRPAWIAGRKKSPRSGGLSR